MNWWNCWSARGFGSNGAIVYHISIGVCCVVEFGELLDGRSYGKDDAVHEIEFLFNVINVGNDSVEAVPPGGGVEEDNGLTRFVLDRS